MFDNILGFGFETFVALILVVSASISAHIFNGYGTRASKETFVGLVIALMIGVQVNFIIF